MSWWDVSILINFFLTFFSIFFEEGPFFLLIWFFGSHQSLSFLFYLLFFIDFINLLGFYFLIRMLNFYRTKQQDTALLKREIYTFVLDSSRPRNQKFIKTFIKPGYILQKKIHHRLKFTQTIKSKVI